MLYFENPKIRRTFLHTEQFMHGLHQQWRCSEEKRTTFTVLSPYIMFIVKFDL